jgi:hypothetical protein
LFQTRRGPACRIHSHSHPIGLPIFFSFAHFPFSPSHSGRCRRRRLSSSAPELASVRRAPPRPPSEPTTHPVTHTHTHPRRAHLPPIVIVRSRHPILRGLTESYIYFPGSSSLSPIACALRSRIPCAASSSAYSPRTRLPAHPPAHTRATARKPTTQIRTELPLDAAAACFQLRTLPPHPQPRPPPRAPRRPSGPPPLPPALSRRVDVSRLGLWLPAARRASSSGLG